MEIHDGTGDTHGSATFRGHTLYAKVADEPEVEFVGRGIVRKPGTGPDVVQAHEGFSLPGT